MIGVDPVIESLTGHLKQTDLGGVVGVYLFGGSVALTDRTVAVRVAR